MTGGHATHTGIKFQDEVAAVFAAYVLAGEPIRFLGLPAGVKPVSIELETTAAVDDLLVRTSDGGFCFINVKKSVATSAKLDSALASIVDQFVRQWLQCKASRGAHAWERPLSAEKDRLLLVAGGIRAQTLVSSGASVLSRILDRGAIVPKSEIATTQAEGKAYDALVGLARTLWERHTGESPSDETVSSFLGLLRFVLLETDDTDRSRAQMVLNNAVLEDASQVDHAWRVLVQECHRLAVDRSGADQARLRDVLRAAGIRLRGIPDFDADIRRLRSHSDRVLADLAHFANLRVPTEAAESTIQIDRASIRALVAAAKSSSFLLIGSPGAGKSGALYSAATTLMAQGHPVVVLAVDQHQVSSLGELSDDVHLEHPLVEALRNWTASKRGILLIDALDATRGGPSDNAFQQLIRQVLQEVPHWNVIASIRSFDLRFGVFYRDRFVGAPVSESLADSDFANVRHLSIPLLQSDELGQVWKASPQMAKAYDSASSALRELLRSPFNLFLLANILLSPGVDQDLSAISTQVGLLDRYWAYRVIGTDREEGIREALLREIATEMVESRTLVVSRSRFAHGGKALRDLQSAGVLTPERGQGDRYRDIAFAHHMIFDYAVARLVLESGHAPDLSARLTASDDRALMLAPAAMMVLRRLWQDGEGDDRSIFWEKSFEIVSAAGAGSFCRMLPARAAAEMTTQRSDFEPVISSLRTEHHPHREEAKFLIRHCVGALTAGVVRPERLRGPLAAEWLAIVRALAEAAIADVGWMIKPIIGQWADESKDLTENQKTDLGIAGRLLLTHCIRERQFEEGVVAVSLKAVARTFNSDPQASAAALKLLLMPDAVREYGHQTLFWLAQESSSLREKSPDVLADLYRAAYCSPLPSREETRSMSRSRILGLITNKRQDFELVQHILAESFGRFVECSPKVATRLLIEIVDCEFEENRHSDEEVEKFPFNSAMARYQRDWSHMWISREGREEKELVKAFQDALVNIAEAGREEDIRQVVDTIVEFNKLACVWSGLLGAGARVPAIFAPLLLPLITTSVVLGSSDTRKSAGDLIEVAYNTLSRESKARVEEAILECDEDDQQIFFSLIASDAIVLDVARDRRAQLLVDRGLRPNDPPLSVSGGWVAHDDDWWLREQGVDLSNSVNTALNAAVKRLEGLKLPASDSERRAYMATHWQVVSDLHRQLLNAPNAPEALRMQAWDKLAEICEKTALACESPQDLTTFSDLEAIVLGSLNDSFWPLRKDSPEDEGSFASLPSWSRPAPRITGAEALMATARAYGSPHPAFGNVIRRLARERSAVVRHQISCRVNMLSQTDPDLMWELCEGCFQHERNSGALVFFVNALHRVVGKRPDWIAENLVALTKRVAPAADDERDRLTEVVVPVFLTLWLRHKQVLAKETIDLWCSEPVEYVDQLRIALQSLRSAIVQGDAAATKEFDERVRHESISIFNRAVSGAASIFAELAARQILTDVERKQAEAALRVLESAATQIYFGSGAYDARKGTPDDGDRLVTTAETRQRFLSEMGPTLKILAAVRYPAVTHHLIETLEAFIPDAPEQVFELVTETLSSGGPAGGYQFESLGADLIVNIVRRYLADHRSVLTSSENNRKALMKALDAFVEAGWPEARKLVYQLPEMLR